MTTDEKTMTTAEAVKAIWVASFEAPKPESHREWASRIEAVLKAYAGSLEAQIADLSSRLDAAQLSDIEARNPGIDMDAVRAFRAGDSA